VDECIGMIVVPRQGPDVGQVEESDDETAGLIG
jgi:hypothetical protein